MIFSLSFLKKIAFLAALLAIAWASLVPQETRPQTGFWDGWEHLAAYFVLGVAGLMAYPAQKYRLFIVGGIIAYGIVLEFLQGFLPGRVPGFIDALANGIGAIAALIAYTGFNRIAGLRQRTRG